MLDLSGIIGKAINSTQLEFKQISTIRVFDSVTEGRPCNLVAVSTTCGVILVGGNSCVKVLLHSKVLEQIAEEDSSKEITPNLCRTVDIPGDVYYVNTSADGSKFSVVFGRDGNSFLSVYSTSDVFEEVINPVYQIPVSDIKNNPVRDLSWNPDISSNMISFCLLDGSVVVYQFLDNGAFDIHTLPSESKSRCLCWSVKGKQLVVGSADGCLIRYKPDLKPVRKIDRPKYVRTSAFVLNVKWLDDTQYAVVYQEMSEEPVITVLLLTAQGNEPQACVMFTDVCFNTVDFWPNQYYFVHQRTWNLLLMAAANSYEVSSLCRCGENNTWIQLMQEDTARVELPMSGSDQSFPLGIAIDYSFNDTLLTGKNELYKGMPILCVMASSGVLCLYSIVNKMQNAERVCANYPVEFSDSSLHYFYSQKNEPGVEAKENYASEEEEQEAQEYVTYESPYEITEPYAVTPEQISSYDSDEDEHVEVEEYVTEAEEKVEVVQEEEENGKQEESIEQQTVAGSYYGDKTTDTEIREQPTDIYSPVSTPALAYQTTPVAPRSLTSISTPTDAIAYSAEAREQIKQLISSVIMAAKSSAETSRGSSGNKNRQNKVSVTRQKRNEMIRLWQAEYAEVQKSMSSLREAMPSEERDGLVNEIQKLLDFSESLEETTVSQENDIKLLSEKMFESFAKSNKVQKVYGDMKEYPNSTLTKRSIQTLITDGLKKLTKDYNATMNRVDECEKYLQDNLENYEQRRNVTTELDAVYTIISVQKDLISRRKDDIRNIEHIVKRAKANDVKLENLSEFPRNCKFMSQTKLRNLVSDIFSGKSPAEVEAVAKISIISQKEIEQPTECTKLNREKISKLKEFCLERIDEICDRLEKCSITSDISENSSIDSYTETMYKKLNKVADSILRIESVLKESPVIGMILQSANQNTQQVDDLVCAQLLQLANQKQSSTMSLPTNTTPFLPTTTTTTPFLPTTTPFLPTTTTTTPVAIPTSSTSATVSVPLPKSVSAASTQAKPVTISTPQFSIPAATFGGAKTGLLGTTAPSVDVKPAIPFSAVTSVFTLGATAVKTETPKPVVSKTSITKSSPPFASVSVTTGILQKSVVSTSSVSKSKSQPVSTSGSQNVSSSNIKPATSIKSDTAITTTSVAPALPLLGGSTLFGKSALPGFGKTPAVSAGSEVKTSISTSESTSVSDTVPIVTFPPSVTSAPVVTKSDSTKSSLFGGGSSLFSTSLGALSLGTSTSGVPSTNATSVSETSTSASFGFGLSLPAKSETSTSDTLTITEITSETKTDTAPTTAAPIFDSSAVPLFGSQLPVTSAPSTTTSIFGTPVATSEAPKFQFTPSSTTSASFFGTSQDAKTLFPFGSPASTTSATTTSANTPLFGGLGTTAFGQAQTSSTSMFGSKPTFGGIFGQADKSSERPLFGGSTAFGSAAGSSVFQQGSSPSSGFGSPPSFGAPSFGTAASFGSKGFGSPAAFGSPLGGFGNQSTVFGQGSTPSGTFGGTQQSTTFENLAKEDTVTFGNLAAQQTPQGFGAPFGSSSSSSKPMFSGNQFNSWRR